MKQYLVVIFLGIFATFLYNYFANLLRAIGNSMVPLIFLAVSAILNVVLDLLCVIVLGWGVAGAAGAGGAFSITVERFLNWMSGTMPSRMLTERFSP